MAENSDSLIFDRQKHFPDLVVKLVYSCNGWVFGSACETDNPRDYDVFIPLSYWRRATMLIPKDAKINSMGGFKCLSEGKEVDVWTGEMSDMLASRFFKCAYHPITDIKIKKENSNI